MKKNFVITIGVLAMIMFVPMFVMPLALLVGLMVYCAIEPTEKIVPTVIIDDACATYVEGEFEGLMKKVEEYETTTIEFPFVNVLAAAFAEAYVEAYVDAYAETMIEEDMMRAAEEEAYWVEAYLEYADACAYEAEHEVEVMFAEMLIEAIDEVIDECAAEVEVMYDWCYERCAYLMKNMDDVVGYHVICRMHREEIAAKEAAEDEAFVEEFRAWLFEEVKPATKTVAEMKAEFLEMDYEEMKACHPEEHKASEAWCYAHQAYDAAIAALESEIKSANALKWKKLEADFGDCELIGELREAWEKMREVLKLARVARTCRYAVKRELIEKLRKASHEVQRIEFACLDELRVEE